MKKIIGMLAFLASVTVPLAAQQISPATPDENIILKNIGQTISVKNTIGTALEAWLLQKEVLPNSAQLLSVSGKISYKDSNRFSFEGTARVIIQVKTNLTIDTNLTFNANLTTPRTFQKEIDQWQKTQIKNILYPYKTSDRSQLEAPLTIALQEVVIRWKKLIGIMQSTVNEQLQGYPAKAVESRLKSLSKELKDFSGR